MFLFSPCALWATELTSSAVDSGGSSDSSSNPSVISVGQSAVTYPLSGSEDPKVGLIHTLNQNPNPPTNLGPAAVISSTFSTNTQPTFTFTLPSDPNNDLVGYEIQITTDAAFNTFSVRYRSALIATSTTTSFTVGQSTGIGTYNRGNQGQILADGRYYWRVETVDSGSAESDFVLATSTTFAFGVDTSSPSAPTLLAPLAGGEVGYNFTFDWSDSTDTAGIASYDIQIATISNFSSICFSTTLITSSVMVSTSDTGLASAFWWRVHAKDVMGFYGAYASTGSYSQDLTPPSSITNLVATSTGVATGVVRLTWTAPGDDGSTGTASQYDVRYSTVGIINTEIKFAAAASAIVNATFIAGSTEVYSLTGLDVGKTYFFAIKARDNAQNWSGLDYSTANITTLIDNGQGTIQWVGEWGDAGVSPPSFAYPEAIYGYGTNIIVADSGQRILRFKRDSTGTFINSWGDSDNLISNPDMAMNSSGEAFVIRRDFIPNIQKVIVYSSTGGAIVRQWGTHGSGPGEFGFLSGIGTDKNDLVYLADSDNDAVHVYTSSGVFIEDLSVSAPLEVAIDLNDNLFVVQSISGFEYLSKLTKDGNLLARYAIPSNENFRYLTFDQDDNLYTYYGETTNYNSGVIKFDPNLQEITRYTSTYGTQSGQIGEFGSTPTYPVYYDSATSNIFLSDNVNHRVQIFKQGLGDITPPGKIKTITASPLSGNSVQVSWGGARDDAMDLTTLIATSYDLRYSTEPITEDSFSSLPSIITSSNTISAVVSGLQANTTYFFVVKAKDAVGNVGPLSKSTSTITSSNRRLIINEVAAAEDQSGGKDFVEFYMAAPTNAGGLNLYENESLVKTFPTTGEWSSSIASGTYIVLHFNDSTSDETTISTSSPVDLYTTTAGLDNSDDVLLLSTGTLTFSGGQVSSGTILDMVAYADQSTGTLSSALQGKLVSGKLQHQWDYAGTVPNQFDAVNSRGMTQARRAIARDQFSNKSASNPSKYDWSYRLSTSSGAVNGSSTTIYGVGRASVTTIHGSTVAVTSATGTFIVSYVVPTGFTNNDGYMLTVDIPSGWTTPTLSAAAGNVSISTPALSTSTYGVAIATGISGTAGRIIVPLGALSAGTTVQIVYGSTTTYSGGFATVQSSTGTGSAAFVVRDDLTGSNVAVASSPFVSLSISSAGIFMAPRISLITGPDPTFQLGEVYSFPNPAKNGKHPTVHVEVGLADSVNLRFYDVAGDLIHETELTGTPPIIDDGQGPQYAYEYTWNSNVASGVYIFAMRAKKSGYSDLQNISKLAVIR